MNIGFKFFIITLFLMGCQSQKLIKNTESIVYTSDHLIIKQLTPNTYQHITFLQTETFGNVPCNGMIVINNNKAIVVDTPINDETAYELINWISKDKNAEIIAVVPTHFHNDCLGGLKAFEKSNIPSYANAQTIELAKANEMNIPQNGFNDTMALPVGSMKVILTFFGEGHTRDNIVAYVENDKVLFGGCLVKELNAGKGYLGDANVDEWSKTVEKIHDYYPNLQWVIPGHGNVGNKELLNFTVQLFKN